MNSKCTSQQYEHYLSTFGKKVLKNLVENFVKRTQCNKIQVQGRYTYSQNKKILSFGDSDISPSQIICPRDDNFNKFRNQICGNKSSCTIERDVERPMITSSQGLLRTAVESVLTENVDVIRMKNNTHHEAVTDLDVYEEFENERVLKNTRVVKDSSIEWDDIIDTQLLNDLNVLDTNNISGQKDITGNGISIQLGNSNGKDLICNNITTDKLMTKNINSDYNTLQHLRVAHESQHNIQSNLNGDADMRKGIRKRLNSNRITNKAKKVKHLEVDVPKNTLRKQKYTKVVKTWLSDVENEKFECFMECQESKDTKKAERNMDTSKPVAKKIVKNTVQAQLTNKGGVMKFGIPKHDNRHDKPDEIEPTTTNKLVCGDFTVKEKKGKSKFVAPVKSQTPVKNISYNIINLNDDNFKVYETILGAITDKNMYIMLLYSNGSCQLDAHTEDKSAVEEVMFEINNEIYYWKHIYKIFCGTMEKVVNQNTVVCYGGKTLLKYLAAQADVNVISGTVKILDMQIAGNLIDPSKPPENFSHLQKMVSFVPEYTVATECVQQKCAWHLSTLGACFVKLRALLVACALWKVFVDIEMRVLPIVAEMEQRGVRVDVERLKSMENSFLKQMKATELACHAAAGRPFQVNSTLQVRNILYGELQLDVKSNITVRETLSKGEKSTSESMLRSLTAVHPLPRLILEYRRLHKAHATFLAGIANLVTDGVVKPTWEQTAAVTGRIACNNPNLQAIPKAPFSLVLFPADDNGGGQLIEPSETYNFRSVYVPRAGHVLLGADFKHVECRVFAYLAADTGLLDALASPDLFRVLAAKWLNKSEEDISSADRERTKRMVYASLYGAGTRKLMEILGAGYDQTLSVVASFNRTFPSLKSFGRSVAGRCGRRGGRLETASGRGRTLPDMFSGDPVLRSQAERQAVNFVVQGSAADLCKLAMVETERRLRSAAPPVAARLLLQIHDELVWEVPREDLHRAAVEIKSAMEGVGQSCGVAVALPVALSAGGTWGHLRELDPTSSRLGTRKPLL